MNDYDYKLTNNSLDKIEEYSDDNLNQSTINQNKECLDNNLNQSAINQNKECLDNNLNQSTINQNNEEYSDNNLNQSTINQNNKECLDDNLNQSTINQNIEYSDDNLNQSTINQNNENLISNEIDSTVNLDNCSIDENKSDNLTINELNNTQNSNVNELMSDDDQSEIRLPSSQFVKSTYLNDSSDDLNDEEIKRDSDLFNSSSESIYDENDLKHSNKRLKLLDNKVFTKNNEDDDYDDILNPTTMKIQIEQNSNNDLLFKNRFDFKLFQNVLNITTSTDLTINLNLIGSNVRIKKLL